MFIIWCTKDDFTVRIREENNKIRECKVTLLEVKRFIYSIYKAAISIYEIAENKITPKYNFLPMGNFIFIYVQKKKIFLPQ